MTLEVCHAETTVFSDEFKREAVELILQPGVTQAQVARELGVGAGLLGRKPGSKRFLGKAIPGMQR